MRLWLGSIGLSGLVFLAGCGTGERRAPVSAAMRTATTTEGYSVDAIGDFDTSNDYQQYPTAVHWDANDCRCSTKPEAIQIAAGSETEHAIVGPPSSDNASCVIHLSHVPPGSTLSVPLFYIHTGWVWISGSRPWIETARATVYVHPDTTPGRADARSAAVLQRISPTHSRFFLLSYNEDEISADVTPAGGSAVTVHAVDAEQYWDIVTSGGTTTVGSATDVPSSGEIRDLVEKIKACADDGNFW